MALNHSTNRVISVFILAMLNVSIMASLRNLPLVAEFGYSSLFFFVVVGLFFLVPCALVSAELATGWPKDGGIYVWVREAFGDRLGFFAIWMQWVHNVTWFPAILSFVATTLASVIYPSIASNPYYILMVVLASYWGMTWLNCRGIKASTLFSTIGVIGGTILPGLFIIFLGVSYLITSPTHAITFSADALLPRFDELDNYVFLGGLFLAFAGLEVSAGYAGEVTNPQKNYPRAIFLGAVITFFLFCLGSLAIAIVIPKEQISLVAGLMDAFRIFLETYDLAWLLPVMGLLLVIGAVAEVNSWIIGPVKGLYATKIHGNLPPYFQKLNKHGMPSNLLVFQALIVSVASLSFLFMPTISSSYWLLSALSTQIYLAMYFLMFFAAIRLRYSKPHVPRAYKIPHPHHCIWLVATLGCLSSLFAFVIFYIPPGQFSHASLIFFESFLIVGFILMSAIPLVLHHFKKPEWKSTL
jgi:putative glutamate/gamma-aminobutyrate antiporter